MRARIPCCGRPASRALKLFRPLLCASFVTLCAGAAAGDPGQLAARVVILANSDDPDSLRIARHYARVRAVPAENIIALPLPPAETITWREFVATLWQPLLDELVRSRWIDAIPMELTDAIGRRKYAPQGHRIAALVVCRGVPLRIAHEAALFSEVPPLTGRGEFRTNAGAVDAELSLLAVPNYPINAFVPNPLFRNDRSTSADLAQVVKVARLDGPAPAQVMALIDRAVAAERAGLLGRAYVDLANRDPVGDGWLDSVAQQLAALGFELTVDREPATFPATARMDAPALYFGWYAGDLNGPFALPGFRFPPGAIALHIHSYSAHTLRSPTTGWAGPLVARGVTATVGNVHEPYLQFTHQPHLFLRALARGDMLVDAAYFSLQALSWQAVLIGDPLYRPFARSLDEQLAGGTGTSSLLRGYAVLRRMGELDAAGRRTDATALAIAAQRETPNLALALELANRFREAGDRGAAARTLGFVSLLREFPTEQWALAREAARLLESCGRPESAVQVWRTLLAIGTIPPEIRIPWLRDAQEAAAAARETEQMLSWGREYDALAAHPRTK
jgi:uncharacterized protein (TIGR03790 family)